MMTNKRLRKNKFIKKRKKKNIINKPKIIYQKITAYRLQPQSYTMGKDANHITITIGTKPAKKKKAVAKKTSGPAKNGQKKTAPSDAKKKKKKATSGPQVDKHVVKQIIKTHTVTK